MSTHQNAGNFRANPERAREAGRKGGQASRGPRQNHKGETENIINEKTATKQ